MEGVDVQFDVRDLQRTLRYYGDRTKNIDMPVIGQLLVNAVDEMFQTEGAAGTDGAWRPLEGTTIRRNPRRAGGMILQATGATANIQVAEVSEFSVTVQSPTEYAGWHLIGTSRMAKRDFFAIRFDKVLDQIADVALQEYA